MVPLPGPDDVPLMEPFSSFIPALDIELFELTMAPVLVGKDPWERTVGRKGSSDGWKERRLKGNLSAPGLGGAKMHDSLCLSSPDLYSLT